MKIVLDTNCLLVIIPKSSKYRKVYDNILNGKISLVVTSEIINEYEEKLIDFYSNSVASNIIKLLKKLDNVEFKEIFYKFNLIPNDPDDNKFVDCAISSAANFIVTNDKHYNVLDSIKFPKVTHIKLEDFCKKI